MGNLHDARVITLESCLMGHVAPDELFPLLTKLIDAQDVLSVQVHPNDAFARQHENSRGKTEMWYILAAKPGARIAAGFRETRGASA